MNDDFSRKVLIVIGVTTIAIALSLLTWQISHILVVTFQGILLAIFIRTLSDPLAKRLSFVSETTAVGIVVVAILLLTIILTVLFAPQIITQAQKIVPEMEKALNKTLYDYTEYSLEEIMNNIPSLEEMSLSTMSWVSDYLSWILNGFTDIFIILFVGLYFAIDPSTYINGLIHLFPFSYRSRTREVLDKIELTLRWWLIGRVISMAIVGVLSGIGLMILGVPFAFLLGFLSALLAFVPVIGPALSVLPPALLAIAVSPQEALYVIVLYGVIQVVESYFLTPIVQERTVALPPVLTIISQLVFGILFGIPGVIVANPVTAMLMVVVKLVYVQDTLGDESVDVQAGFS